MRVSAAPFIPGDEAELFRRGLRPGDEREAWKVAGISARAALPLSIGNSLMTATVRIDGNIAAILGVGRLDLLSGIGLPWFVGTPEIERPAAAVPMVRLIRRFLLHWLTVFPRLENVADPDHVTALRLLAWVGFTIEPAQVRGPLGHNLVYFWRQRACA